MVDEVVGSEMPTYPSQQKLDRSGYGQNGFRGPSSDMPGEPRTTSGFLPQAVVTVGDWQTRKVSAEGYPIHPGMKSPAAPLKITKDNVRPGAKPITNSSFQR